MSEQQARRRKQSWNLRQSLVEHVASFPKTKGRVLKTSRLHRPRRPSRFPVSVPSPAPDISEGERTPIQTGSARGVSNGHGPAGWAWCV